MRSVNYFQTREKCKLFSKTGSVSVFCFNREVQATVQNREVQFVYYASTYTCLHASSQQRFAASRAAPAQPCTCLLPCRCLDPGSCPGPRICMAASSCMAAQARPCWLQSAAGCWHAGMCMQMHVYVLCICRLRGKYVGCANKMCRLRDKSVG